MIRRRCSRETHSGQHLMALRRRHRQRRRRRPFRRMLEALLHLLLHLLVVLLLHYQLLLLRSILMLR